MFLTFYCIDVLLSQPDSFPFKCEMLAMKSDRLMLLIVLMAVFILVTKVTHSVAMITDLASESSESNILWYCGNSWIFISNLLCYNFYI